MPKIEDHAALVADEFERYVAWCQSPRPLQVIAGLDHPIVANDDPSPSQRDYWLPDGTGTIRVTFERVWG